MFYGRTWASLSSFCVQRQSRVRTRQSSDYSVIVVVPWSNKQVLRDTPKWVPSSWKCLVLEEMVLQAQSTKPTINKEKKGLQAYNIIRMSLEAYLRSGHGRVSRSAQHWATLVQAKLCSDILTGFKPQFVRSLKQSPASEMTRWRW
jgi:hypothetical protein